MGNKSVVYSLRDSSNCNIRKAHHHIYLWVIPSVFGNYSRIVSKLLLLFI